MTLPQWMLMAFALWTLAVLAFTIGVHRWRHILGGTRAIHTFRADASDGPDWYRRATRAHANCVENLPVFGALVALASLTSMTSTLIDALACAIMAARVGQTTTHVAFPETKRSVSVRFGFFMVQHCGMVAMGVLIAAHRGSV